MCVWIFPMLRLLFRVIFVRNVNKNFSLLYFLCIEHFPPSHCATSYAVSPDNFMVLYIYFSSLWTNEYPHTVLPLHSELFWRAFSYQCTFLINHSPFYCVCLDWWYILKENYLFVLLLKTLLFYILNTLEEINVSLAIMFNNSYVQAMIFQFALN